MDIRAADLLVLKRVDPILVVVRFSLVCAGDSKRWIVLSIFFAEHRQRGRHGGAQRLCPPVHLLVLSLLFQLPPAVVPSSIQ
jgi:hypothetical protein